MQQSWLPLSQQAFSAAQHSAWASQHFSWPSQQASPFWQQAGFSAAAQHAAPASQQGKPNAQQSSPILAVPPALTVVIAIASAANEANANFVNMISLQKGGPHIAHFSAHGDRIEKQKKNSQFIRGRAAYIRQTHWSVWREVSPATRRYSLPPQQGVAGTMMANGGKVHCHCTSTRVRPTVSAVTATRFRQQSHCPSTGTG